MGSWIVVIVIITIIVVVIVVIVVIGGGGGWLIIGGIWWPVARLGDVVDGGLELAEEGFPSGADDECCGWDMVAEDEVDGVGAEEWGECYWGK